MLRHYQVVALLFWAGLLTVSSTLAQAAPPSHVWYVAPNGKDSWSGDRATPNATRTDGPFATLARARDAVRADKQRQGGRLTWPVRILIRQGTYFLKQTLRLTPDDSGTPTCPITYAAYPGEHPIISGGIPITGWTPVTDHGRKLWSAPVPPGSQFRTLRVSNRWVPRARWPHADAKHPITGGWLFAQEISDSTQVNQPHGAFSVPIAPGAVPARLGNLAGAEMHIFPGPEYYNAILPVLGSDPANHTILVRNDDPSIQSGNRFYLENVPAALEVPSEWVLDRAQSKLRLIPDVPHFPHVPVVAGHLETLIVLQGTPIHEVSHVQFTGLTFRDSEYALTTSYFVPADAVIRFSRAASCTVSDCDFGWLSGYALRLESLSHDIQFVRNRLHDLGEGGVVMLGDNRDQPYHNTVAQNTMRHLGLVYKHVAGIYVTTGSDNRIIHNTISDVPRYGISLKTNGDSAGSHRNLVAFNDIRRTNRETKDSGAIEMLGRDRQNSGNVIRDNLILDSGGLGTDEHGKITTPTFTWGIYLDDFSSGVLVYGNIVVGTVQGGFDIHGGRNDRIENNIFVGARKSALSYQSIEPDFMRGSIFTHNIVTDTPRDGKLVETYDSPANAFKIWDHNLYWRVPAAKTGDGHDAHSIIADPQFRDPAHGDYSLRPTSPAFALGFRPIPTNQIGAQTTIKTNVKRKIHK